jgi:teichuronic acid biosynthesis glycosyltransferase TuaC
MIESSKPELLMLIYFEDISLIRYLADSLSKKFQITIISPAKIHRLIYYRSKYKNLYHQFKNNHIHFKLSLFISFSNIKLLGWNLSMLSANLSVILSLNRKKYEHVYIHFWDLLYAGYYLKQQNLVRNIIVASGESKITINQKLPSNKMKNIINHCDGLIALSHKNYKESLSLGFRFDKRFSIIPNAPNEKVFFYINNDRFVNINEVNFLFVGNNKPHKNLKRLLQAFLRIENKTNLIIVGVSNKNSMTKADNIKYIGALEPDKLNEVYNQCHVLVHPSIAEGSSNVINEAIACGLAIIASDLEFNDEILDDSYSLRCDMLNTTKIYNTIQSLIDDKDLLLSMHNAALKRTNKWNLSIRSNQINTFIQTL